MMIPFLANQKCCRTGCVFLSQVQIKVILPNLENEIALNNATDTINVLFLRCIMRMSWVENV